MFSLSKWYLDCVTDTGDASIAYTGEVVWGKFRLRYASLLESAGARVTERHSLRNQIEPQIKNGRLHWGSNVLQADGEWELDWPAPKCAGIEKTIFRSPQGSVKWHCLAPNAKARLGTRSGLGYAEHLAVTVPPWKLPIQSLSWGRFTSDSHWVVWIDWRGEPSQRIVYANGEAVRAAVIEDGRVELANGAQLTMDRSLVLRDGPLGTAALSRIPGIQKIFPARLLQVRECKWRSRGRLECQGGLILEGWTIHERVEWPK